MLCLIIRHESSSSAEGVGEKAILKFGFVAENFELLIPISKLLPSNTGAHAPITDVDATSMSLTNLFFLGARRLLTSRFVSTLITKA